MHVIKKNKLRELGTAVRDAETFLERQVRIPAAAVKPAGFPERQPAVEAAPGHVIRKGQARLSVRPFELDMRDLLAPAPAATEAAPSRNPAPVPEPEPEPEPSLDELLAARDAEWEVRLRQETAAAREEGYHLGHAEASATLGEQHEEKRQALLADLAHLSGQWQAFLERMEPTLANLSFEIAQSVLESPLPPNVKGIAARAITEAVEQMAGHAPIEIILHPVDFLRLQESGVVEQLESLHSGMRWEPRPDMRLGDWIVQCPAVAFRRMEEELLAALRNRLGLLAAVEKERGLTKPAPGSSPAH